MYRIAIITASDKGAKGERADKSGPVIREMCQGFGEVSSYAILADEREEIAQALRKICAAEFSHSKFRLLGSSKKSMAFRMRYPFSLYHGFVGCWTMMIFLKESRTCSNAACSCIIFPLSGMGKAD